jgi:alpha-ketoglutarate-dependent taurine dioxygenase
MSLLTVKPLRGDLSFGARIAGLSLDALNQDAVRRQLIAVLDARGVLLFENVDPTSALHVALSEVFGSLKEIQAQVVARTEQDTPPTVIDIRHDPEDAGIVEIDGKQISHWLPWHFDHCYNDTLWHAAVLRPVVIPANGGLTGFVDGIQMFQALPPALRARIDGLNILYTLDVLFEHMRFGKPAGFREIRVAPTNYGPTAMARDLPRGVHPAVWARPSGEKVLHVSPWMAVGIEHHEDAEGDALLEAVCQAMLAHATPYFHQWQPTELIAWDNWRMLHSVTGTSPESRRRMQRTTILGDYGLGFFEKPHEAATA